MPVTPFTALKLALSGVGVVIFGWGVRSNQPAVRWVGIGLLAVAFAVRFIDPSRRR